MISLKTILYYLVSCSAILAFTSCNPNIKQAKEFVYKADSLQNIGQNIDSASIEEAYAILHKFRYFYLDDYTHACYCYARMFYNKGAYVKSTPYYLETISHASQNKIEIKAHAYRDLTEICHLGGYNRLAYELNEKAIYHFKRAYNHYEYEMAMCRKAVLKYILGSADESITLLQYITQQSKNGIVKARTEEYISLLIEDRTPVLVNTTRQLNATELYTAIEDIKYELQRKPFLWRMFLIFAVIILGMASLYVTHSNILRDFFVLREERKKTRKCINGEIEQYCAHMQAQSHIIKKELCWADFNQMCKIVNLHMGNIIDKLLSLSSLNETELRLCVLVMIDLSRNQIAETLPYSQNSIGKLKNTVSKKIGTDGKNMRNMLMKIAMQV